MNILRGPLSGPTRTPQLSTKSSIARPARYGRSTTHGYVAAGERYLSKATAKAIHPKEGVRVLLRRELGDVLRNIRVCQGRTLREISVGAKVSLGYLSEVERGQKEASSELLGSICEALGIPMWLLLREVADRIAAAEGVRIPDTVPDEFEALSAVD